MIKSIMEFCRQKKSVLTKMKLYLDGIGVVEYFSMESLKQQCIFSVDFISKKRVVTKNLCENELRKELLCTNNKKMIIISGCRDEKLRIYKMLNDISNKNGISAPFIELDNKIIYFPKLRYSDLGLLRFLCDQNMRKYKLLLVSGN